MNEHEARLAIIQRVCDTLLDFTEDAPSPEDIEEMLIVAETIIESLDLDVMNVVNDTIACHINLEYADADETTDAEDD